MHTFRYDLMRTVRSATPAIVLFAVTGSGPCLCRAQQALYHAAPQLPFALADRSTPALSSSENEADSDALPEAPSYTLAGADAGQSGNGGLASNSASIAKKWSPVILAGQAAQPLSSRDKVNFGLRETISPFTLLSVVISATYSQGVDSAPHYGQGWAPYGQRIGAAAARNTIQTLASQAIFAPLFHDDPRYYQLGGQHKILNRAVYAATRVLITRSDAGQSRVNLPLLAGYAVAAGANNAYYPERDRGGKETATSFASSLGGAALGMEVNEFLTDALRLAHLRRFSW